jgi:hypothetical protein
MKADACSLPAASTLQVQLQYKTVPKAQAIKAMTAWLHLHTFASNGSLTASAYLQHTL